MRHNLSLGIAATLVMGIAKEGHGQQVAADIHIGTWPVAATVHIGDRPWLYGRPRRVVVEHRYPRLIVVEGRRGHAPYDRKWRRNARLVTVYYDRHCNKYFDSYRRGLDEIRAYEYDGRLYRYDDDRYFDDHDRRYDRDRYDRDRWSDRDRGHRNDRDHDDDDYGSWEHDHQ